MAWGELARLDQVTTVLGLLGLVLAAILGAVVYRTRKGSRLNLLVATVLATEALLAGTLACVKLFDLGASFAALLVLALFLVADSVATLLFLGELHPAWVRRWGTRPARALIVAGGVVLLTATAWHAYERHQQGVFVESDDAYAPVWMVFGATAFVAFVATLHDFWRTQAGSAARRQARAFATAFGARNGLIAVGILAWGVSDVLGLVALRAWTEILGVAGMVLLPALLAYGVLSTQLFDIELKLKLGIKSGTLAAILVGGFFAAYKVVEFYLGREYGYAFGGVLSGVFFFLAPRLNKFADGVANRALPQAQPTPDYIAYKKLEVYKAAVESALEDGTLDARDRTLLDSLRRKLALKAADADAIEAELRAAAPQVEAAPA